MNIWIWCLQIWKFDMILFILRLRILNYLKIVSSSLLNINPYFCEYWEDVCVIVASVAGWLSGDWGLVGCSRASRPRVVSGVWVERVEWQALTSPQITCLLFCARRGEERLLMKLPRSPVLFPQGPMFAFHVKLDFKLQFISLAVRTTWKWEREREIE